MKQTINFYDFQKAFQDLRPNSFTYEGLRALFEYIEEIEDTHNEEMELDVIALCCDFIEYESAEEYASEYSDDLEDYLAATSDSGSLIVYAH
jgi:hypothetical protein